MKLTQDTTAGIRDLVSTFEETKVKCHWEVSIPGRKAANSCFAYVLGERRGAFLSKNLHAVQQYPQGLFSRDKAFFFASALFEFFYLWRKLPQEDVCMILYCKICVEDGIAYVLVMTITYFFPNSTLQL